MSASVPDRAAASRLHLLTILRFFAAAWVLVFHLQMRVPLTVGPWMTNFLANGALAMTLFFLLSGAVLALGYRTLQLNAPALSVFYRARVARIMPAFLTIQLLALVWFTPAMVGWPKWLFVNVFSFVGLQAWFVEMIAFGANAGTWSISVEVFFYTVFPVALLLMIYLRDRIGASRLLVYLSLFCGLLGMNNYALGPNFFYYIAPYCRLPEFLLGVVVGLQLADPPRAGSRPGLLLTLSTLLAALAAINPAHHYGLWIRANFFVVPAFAWLIFALARFEQHRAGRAWNRGLWRIPLYLGESSYCLFLAQLVPLLWLASPAGTAWQKATLATRGLATFWWLVIAASFVGAILLHEAVEKPARRALLRRWQPSAAGLRETKVHSDRGV